MTPRFKPARLVVPPALFSMPQAPDRSVFAPSTQHQLWLSSTHYRQLARKAAEGRLLAQPLQVTPTRLQRKA